MKLMKSVNIVCIETGLPMTYGHCVICRNIVIMYLQNIHGEL